MASVKQACKFLFVYGTLRQAAGSEMFRLLVQYADFINYARYQGKLYKIDDYPGVVPSSNPVDSVIGEVYRIHDLNLVLSMLDNYEECGVNYSESSEYLRTIQLVRLFHGEVIQTWMYLYNRPTDNFDVIVSGDFLNPGCIGG